jgi:hypothetical protein
MDWNDVAQNGDRGRVVVYAAMNLGVSNSAGNFLTS